MGAGFRAVFVCKEDYEDMVMLNGEKRDGLEGKNIAEVLESCGYDAATVVVECNEEIVRRDSLAQHMVGEGDQIEVIHFVGGGR